MPSATIALHHRDGMVREGHLAGVTTTEGTHSLSVGAVHLATWARISIVEVIGAASEIPIDAKPELSEDATTWHVISEPQTTAKPIGENPGSGEPLDKVNELREMLHA